MSYHIVYDKQFIKIPPKEGGQTTYIPMVLSGDNNVWESSGGRERRARDWWNVSFLAPDIIATQEEMENRCMEVRGSLIDQNEERLKEYPDWDKYTDKRFGYFAGVAIGGSTHTTTFGQYLGIVRTGCKKSLTVEQLVESGVSIRVSFYSWGNEAEEQGVSPFTRYPTTTDELLSAIVEGQDHLKDTGFQLSVYYDSIDAKYLRWKYFPVKRKKSDAKLSDHFYTITIEGKYLSRMLKYGYRYGHSPVLKLTEKTANRKHKRLSEKYLHYTFDVKRVDQQAFIY